MKRFFKIIGVILLLIPTLWLFNLIVVERVQAYMDAKDYLERTYPSENLRISDIMLDFIYGKYWITVEPEHKAWYNSEFHLFWYLSSKEIGMNDRSPKINEYYWSMRDWRSEYTRIVGELIQQEYHGEYEDYIYDVLILTKRFIKDKDTKELQERVQITDSEFPTKDIPAEIVFRINKIPEDKIVFLEEEVKCLKKIVDDNGYTFKNYYVELSMAGYQLLPSGELIRTGAIWYGL